MNGGTKEEGTPTKVAWQKVPGNFRTGCAVPSEPVGLCYPGESLVPEGRRDRSQVRSAWFGVRNDARPGGTFDGSISPKRISPLESYRSDDGQPDSAVPPGRAH
jgi:hypothetical protein